MAIGIIIGGAFGPIVGSMVNDILMPPPEPNGKDCPFCFSAIPINPSRCPHCPSALSLCRKNRGSLVKLDAGGAA